MHGLRKILSLISISVLLFESSFVLISPADAKADDLVIQDNGSIILLITGSGVLAAETSKDSKGQKSAPAPAPSVTSTKVVVPPKTDSTVKIDPKPSNDNKVKIIVQTPAAPLLNSGFSKNTPAPNTNPQGSGLPPASLAPSTNPSPTTVSAPQTVVDKVVLNGPDEKPLITISGDNSKNLNIQNGSVSLSTNLPIQVDNSVAPDGTVKHDLSVTDNGKQVKISVLPDVAVKAADTEVVPSSLSVSKKDVTLNRTSSEGTPNSEPTYVVKEQRSGKLFGLIGVTLSSQVEISATSGKTTSTWQSPLSIFSFLIK